MSNEVMMKLIRVIVAAAAGLVGGIYMAGRFVYETQAPPLDWFMVVGGSLLLVGGTIALLYWGFQEGKV